MLVLILIFAVVHSGLASLRNTGEKLIGERAFRVLFAGVSLPLAVTTIVSFYYVPPNNLYSYIFPYTYKQMLCYFQPLAYNGS